MIFVFLMYRYCIVRTLFVWESEQDSEESYPQPCGKGQKKIQIGQNRISQRSSLNVHLQYLQENIYSMILNMNKKT